MRVADQLDTFTRRLVQWEELRDGFRERRATGASNTPFPIKGGFRIGIWNIENTDFLALIEKCKGFVVVSPITLPPGEYTICTAIILRGQAIEAISRRRDEIRVELDKRPNNVAFFLRRGGLILTPLTDLTDLTCIDSPSLEVGRPVSISAACYADVQRSHALDSVGTAYIDYLTDLLWPIPFVRLDETGRPMTR